ncbi:hypothetical protein Cflav_PD6278, partial [Pedosphaera parvula Ellin514]
MRAEITRYEVGKPLTRPMDMPSPLKYSLGEEGGVFWWCKGAWRVRVADRFYDAGTLKGGQHAGMAGSKSQGAWEFGWWMTVKKILRINTRVRKVSEGI